MKKLFAVLMAVMVTGGYALAKEDTKVDCSKIKAGKDAKAASSEKKDEKKPAGENTDGATAD